MEIKTGFALVNKGGRGGRVSYFKNCFHKLMDASLAKQMEEPCASSLTSSLNDATLLNKLNKPTLANL